MEEVLKTIGGEGALSGSGVLHTERCEQHACTFAGLLLPADFKRICELGAGRKEGRRSVDEVLKTIGGEGAVDARTTNLRGLLGDKQRIKNLDDVCDSF